MIDVSALALILLAVMLSARDKDRKADLRQFLPLNLHQVLILTCLKLAVDVADIIPVAGQQTSVFWIGIKKQAGS